MVLVQVREVERLSQLDLHNAMEPLMIHLKPVSSLLLCTLLLTPISWAQITPNDYDPVLIYQLLDLSGQELGRIAVVSQDGGIYQAGFEYWQVSEEFLLTPEETAGLQIIEVTSGAWDDEAVLAELEVGFEGATVEWHHPALVSWTETRHQSAPNLSEASYFGDPSIGGFSIRYEPGEYAALTWFNFTGADYVPFTERTVFTNLQEAPSEGSWWHGPIYSIRR